MKPDEMIILILTFLTGVVAGVFLHVMVYAPQYEADPVAEQSAFLVTGEQYGGCKQTNTCVSFRLEADGAYQYLVNEARRDGSLPSELYKNFAAMITDFRLRSHAAPVESEDCVSFVDGIDYRYDFVLDGERYRLDTCRTTLSYGSELQQSLLAVWEYMANPEAESQYPVIIEEGVAGWLRSRLQQ